MKTNRTNPFVAMGIVLIVASVTIITSASNSNNMPHRDIEGIWMAAAEKPDTPAPPVIFRIAINATVPQGPTWKAPTSCTGRS